MKVFFRFITFIGILCLTASPNAFGHDAGGMSGGGGGLVRDLNNPWFLENTTRVNYCINIDSSHFHADLTYARKMISLAFTYWKAEFSDTFIPQVAINIPPVKIATQEFVEVECNQMPDIRFQLGYLTEEQMRIFDDPTRYAGAAIRETYDVVNLKARGFVYISPDSGSLRYAGISDTISDFWRLGQGGLLYRTLVHELGHVFGLRHTSDESNIMGERFIETMTIDRNYVYYANNLTLADFFKFRGSAGSGTSGIDTLNGLSEETLNFFGLPARSKGMWMFVKGQSELEVKSAVDSERPSVAGLIELLPADTQQWSEAVSVYLPDEQRVFSIPQELHLRNLPGPHITSDVRRGIYRSINGRVQREVLLHLNPSGPEYFVGAVIDGRIAVNVVH